jgi:hypothetical protein
LNKEFGLAIHYDIEDYREDAEGIRIGDKIYREVLGI